MKGKRVSRHDLIEKIKRLERENRIAKSDELAAVRARDEIKKRFMDLGSRVMSYETRGSGIECIEVKPEPWGMYMRLSPGMELSDSEMDVLKKRLVSDIVNGLMESNAIQIIVNNDRLFPDNDIIVAKLFVVPWDKMAKKLIVRM